MEFYQIILTAVAVAGIIWAILVIIHSQKAEERRHIPPNCFATTAVLNPVHRAEADCHECPWKDSCYRSAEILANRTINNAP